jgi:hypothetical protein
MKGMGWGQGSCEPWLSRTERSVHALLIDIASATGAAGVACVLPLTCVPSTHLTYLPAFSA